MEATMERTSKWRRTLRHVLLGTVAACAVIAGAHAATPAVDDTVVAGAIRHAFAQEFGASAQGIWVEVYRGAVYLSGRVATAEERARAEQIAKRVQGVVSVTSEFDPTPSGTRVAGADPRR
jgi:hyperosmotically inducible protein